MTNNEQGFSVSSTHIKHPPKFCHSLFKWSIVATWAKKFSVYIYIFLSGIIFFSHLQLE